jgi:hypothetical protein
MHRVACAELGVAPFSRIPSADPAYSRWCENHGIAPFPFSNNESERTPQARRTPPPSPVVPRGATSRYQFEKAQFRQIWEPRIGPDAVRMTGLCLRSLAIAVVAMLGFAGIGIVGGLTNHEYRLPQLILLGLTVLTFGATWGLSIRRNRLIREAVGVPNATLKRIPNDEDTYVEWCQKAGVTPHPFGCTRK